MPKHGGAKFSFYRNTAFKIQNKGSRKHKQRQTESQSQANVSHYASFGHMTPMQEVWLGHVLCLWLSLQL